MSIVIIYRVNHRHTKKLFTLIQLILLLMSYTWAQDKLSRSNLLHNRLTIDNGLPDNMVRRIVQDRQGFIWLATDNGLARFDGTNTKIYRHIPGDSSSLPGNILIDMVYVPTSNIFYILSYEGLVKFCPENESFTLLKHSGIPQSKQGDLVFGALLDSKQRLWVLIRNKGIRVIDTRNDRLIASISDENVPQVEWRTDMKIELEDDEGYCWLSKTSEGFIRIGLKDNRPDVRIYQPSPPAHRQMQIRATAMCKDSRGNLWFANSGLFRLSAGKTGQDDFEHIDIFDGRLPRNNEEFLIINMIADKNNQIWISTAHEGIKRYTPETRQVENTGFASVNFKNVQSNIARFAKDRKQNIWLMFTNSVLAQYDYSSGKLITFHHSPYNPVSPLDKYSVNNFSDLFFQDQSGAYWLAGNGNGAGYFSLRKTRFPVYSYNPSQAGGLSGNTVWGIYEDTNGLLWLGIRDEGLNILDLKTGQAHFLSPTTDAFGEGFDKISCFLQTGPDEYWIGSIPPKVVSYAKEKRKMTLIREFRPRSDDTASIANWAIRSMYKDRQGRIYLGTVDAGIEEYLGEAKGFRHYPPGPDKTKNLVGGQVWNIMEDNQERLWISTNGGISRMNRERSGFTAFVPSRSDTNSLSHNRVTMCFQDRKGRIWATTEGGGLNQYLESENRFVRYKEANGFPSDYLYAVYDDQAGNLWLSSKAGLIRFNPESREHIVFTTNDGLQSSQFMIGSYHRGADGTIYFGGSGGVNHFHPDSIHLSNYEPVIRFTAMRIGNTEIIANRAYDGKIWLKKDMTYTKELVLNYRQNYFEIRFSAMDYAAPANIRYRYRIEGRHTGWIDLPAGNNSISFAELPPGSYTLYVKSTNSDGLWCNNTAMLHITITPPWWRTIPAYVAYFLVITLILLFLRRIVVFRLKYKNQLEIERLEFEKRQLELTRKQELEQAKTAFFTNISHEFRTPLTLILGPIENMLKSALLHEKLRPQIALLHRNANRLLHLINQILDLRRLEAGQTTQNLKTGNLLLFIQNISDDFSVSAREHQIEYVFDTSGVQAKDCLQNILFDADMIEKVLYNLLANAFKYTPDNGKISISLCTQHTEVVHESKSRLTLFLSVADNGRGISADDLPHIFDRFSRGQNNTPLQTGSGLGLSLVKELVTLHGGTIAVVSSEGNGSTFTVSLPLSTSNTVTGSETHDIPEAGNNKTAPLLLTDDAIQNDVPESAPLLLIVDDNPDIRQYVADGFNTSCRIMEAEDGLKGFELAQQEIPDLIISDMMMPVMDGIALCKKIKNTETTSHIPVVMLTAKATSESQLQGLKTGADDYIMKPFSMEVLQLKVHNLLQLRNNIIEQYRRNNYSQPLSVARNNSDKVFLTKALNVVNRFIDNPDFDTDLLAAELGMSRTGLYRKFQAMTGQAASEFIRSTRLNYAAELMAQSDYNVSEIAILCGISVKNFSTQFKRQFNLTPSEYIEKHRP